MEKLKSRLDAFSDGIMAVIITIMVLNVSPVLHDSWGNYLNLGKHIGIYLITFVFIANMWYQHSTAFAEIDTMTYRILIWDMVFLAMLSLMPLFTDMMAANTTRVTVMLYGGLQSLVTIIFRMLAKAIIHLQYTETTDMQQVYQKIYGNANHWLDGLSGGALIAAFFFPHSALIFYLAYPVLSFLLNARARQQMYDAAALPSTQQKALAALPAKDYSAWQKTAHNLVEQGAPAAATNPLPANWQQWLNQNVDPRRQQQVAARFSQMTPAQQAKMASWFEQRARHLRQHRGQRPTR